MTDYQDDLTSPSPHPVRSKTETAKLVAGAVLLVVLVLFVVVNTEKTRIDFLVGSVDMPLVVVLLVTAAIGGAITELFRYARNRRK